MQAGGGAAVNASADRSRSGPFVRYTAIGVVVSSILFAAWLIASHMSLGRVAYCIALWWICSYSLFFHDTPADRLLVFFMMWYFAIFGLHTMLAVLFGPTESTLLFLRAYQLDTDHLASPDLVVLVGSILFAIGYRSVLRLHPAELRILTRDWNPTAALWTAVGCWIPGFIFSLAYYLVVTPENIPTHLLHVPLNIASNMRLLTMLATIMLIYLAFTGYRARMVWTLLVAMIVMEYLMGFAANTKEVSYRILALILMGGFFLTGRVNKKLLLFILVTFIPYHMFFTVYRSEILQVRGRTALEAVQDMERTQSVLEKYAGREESVVRDNLQALADRVNGKHYVDIIVSRTGKDVAYQKGATLANVIYTFVPRAFWPTKPDTSTGQLFNREFGLSESSLTFVPTTFLGEFYWNFGWVGVVIGMVLVGASLGIIGKLHSVRDTVTLPRFVLLLIACYYLVLRFEASIGQQYGIFGRMLIVLLVLHAGMATVGLLQSRRHPGR
jgi:hypothetical protein